MIIEEGAIANIHMDGNWERDLDFFKAFPKGKVVLDVDDATNIYTIKEKLGDRLCIYGNVSPAMFALASPDEVYNYCTKLIRDMDTGFILSSGCSVPPNAKKENVRAMVAAAAGK